VESFAEADLMWLFFGWLKDPAASGLVRPPTSSFTRPTRASHVSAEERGFGLTLDTMRWIVCQVDFEDSIHGRLFRAESLAFPGQFVLTVSNPSPKFISN
jgi:hypothetical protein